MINLSFTVGDIDSVMLAFDTIQIKKFKDPTGSVPTLPIDDTVAANEYDPVSSGTDRLGGCYPTACPRDGVSDLRLNLNYSQYYFDDEDGEAYDWYISRYYSDPAIGGDGSTSGWSDPVLGEAGDIYYDPLYPPEVAYGTEDQQIVERIRTYIGDPVGLRREYGEDAASSIHLDGKTYELDEKGWPASVNMNGKQYTSTINPSINGYRYLRFKEYIDIESDPVLRSTSSGTCDDYETITYGVDIWYYTFRHSDRQIMEAYDRCPIPPGLTEANVTTEAYVLQTAINLLYQENWEDAIEDGAVVTDEQSRYDPTPGLRFRDSLLDKLNKKLDDLVKGLVLRGIEGVLLD